MKIENKERRQRGRKKKGSETHKRKDTGERKKRKGSGRGGLHRRGWKKRSIKKTEGKQKKENGQNYDSHMRAVRIKRDFEEAKVI